MHKGDITIKGMWLILGKLCEVLKGGKSRGKDEGGEGNWNGKWTV